MIDGRASHRGLSFNLQSDPRDASAQWQGLRIADNPAAMSAPGWRLRAGVASGRRAFPEGDARASRCGGGETSPPPCRVVAALLPERVNASVRLSSGAVASLGMFVANQSARWSSLSTTCVSLLRRCEWSVSGRAHDACRSENWCFYYPRGVVSLARDALCRGSGRVLLKQRRGHRPNCDRAACDWRGRG